MHKMLILTLFSLCLYSFSAFSQDTTSSAVPFVIVEEVPEFPGGEAAMMKYLTDNIKWTDLELSETIPGTLYLSFVIDTDGSVKDVKVLRSSMNQSLDNSAIEAIKNMPRWKPGRQDGKEVKVMFTIPIKIHPQ